MERHRMVTLATALFAASACSGSAGSTGDAAPGDGPSLDAAPGTDAGWGNPLDGIGSVEEAAGGFLFIEGPVWWDGALYFSDISANRVYRRDPSGEVTVFRDPSGNSNGLGIDAAGRLLACEQSAHRVTRTAVGGSVEVVADLFGGMPFLSPNDIAVGADGTIWFTDPDFEYSSGAQPVQGVYRVDPTGVVSLVTGEIDFPNGIALSPDGRTLYVSATSTSVVHKLAISDDGTAGPPELFAATRPAPDGLCVDDAGNLYVATIAGVLQIFAPDGQEWGRLDVPIAPRNCAFGDDDRRTLYLTAGATLYRVRVVIPGAPF